MAFDLIIQGGTVVTPQDVFQADIGIRDGRILAIGELKGEGANARFDAGGLYVLPGIIDEHIHSRDPGLTHKEDFYHASQAAAAGGVTTVIDMPNCVPPVTNATALRDRVARLEASAFVDFALYGMILGARNVADLPELAAGGVVGFKFFWGYALNPQTLEVVYHFRPGDPVIFPPGRGEIYESFRVAAQTGLPVAIHAEDTEVISWLVDRAARHGTLHESYRAFLDTRPPFTEAVIAKVGIDLARAAGCHLHILHVSSRETIKAIAQARARNQPVTAETCPHYLFLTAADFDRVGTVMKLYPPIREAEDRESLWEALNRSVLQAVGSDHSPQTPDEKAGDIWKALAGTWGVQTLLPMMLEAVARGRLDLRRMVACLSEGPARIWGLYGRKGCIRPGADADLVLVDPTAEWTITREWLLYRHALTPFENEKVRGRPVATLLRGRWVMQDGKVLGEPSGRFIRPVSKPQAFW